jgi:hypothetical protein
MQQDAATMAMIYGEPPRKVRSDRVPKQPTSTPLDPERARLHEASGRHRDWKHWGPYLAERAWGTVREDYSANGDAWNYFPHDHARSRAYRWNEDGIGGICNRFQNVCLAVALWNERDPILKERFFGLTNQEGNHGEDVKEYYFYLDNTPTHSYMKMLYKYPQVAYPYEALIHHGRQRGDGELELVDVLREAFAAQRYFDVVIEYAKADTEDILCRITAVNRGSEAAPLHILPHIWFRNTWSWGYSHHRPELRAVGANTICVRERHLGERWWQIDSGSAEYGLLFTENDTNRERLFGVKNTHPYVKDGINDAVIQRQIDRVNPALIGTKAAAHVRTVIPAGGEFSIRLRFSTTKEPHPFDDFDAVFGARIDESNQFYAGLHHPDLTEDEQRVQRQALAGTLWSKQFYHYSVELWQDGDPSSPPPPASRRYIRNNDWRHLYNLDVLSMPDKWEYPWFAAWDLAFHTIPIAMVDPEWAKRQLILLLREWYMHPNGQIPAYEWKFDDVNPPVHAWAAWQVYQMDKRMTGTGDTAFLERVFHKLLLNFTWWVNRKDADGNNVFQGGFLGLDNIGIFDRSAPLPNGAIIQQADGTAWMGMYCLNMLAIALELARSRPAYEDVATKFFEHFIYIANAMHDHGLWDEQDGLFYDTIRWADGRQEMLKVRSFVGLIPMLAVEILDEATLERLPHFKRRMEWFIKYRPEWVQRIASLAEPGSNKTRLLSILSKHQLEQILKHVFDEQGFFSAYGLRSVSRYHAEHPYRDHLNGQEYTLEYEPAESKSPLYGGNSNWRGPIWFPINYLMVEALRTYHRYYGEQLQIAVPTGGSGAGTLDAAADVLSGRLCKLFLRQADGQRAVLGEEGLFQNDPHWHDHIPFYEYFHGDSGMGLGASHQTGWTALVAALLQHR